jgi:hypothetical protein
VDILILKPGLIRWLTRDPGLKPGQVEEKTRKGKILVGPGDLAIPGQKFSSNTLIFVFLLKQRRFDFFKKKNRSGRPG